jgi:ABC-type sugar transport system ATPase subunit
MSETPVVHMESIVKRFGTVTALDNVDLTVGRQQVMALVGDNGAGKSTLIKILTGIYMPTSGQIYFEGQPVQIRSPQEARALGIETVYQDLALVNQMSIARNFFLGREPVRQIGPVHWLDMRKMNDQTYLSLRDIGIEILPRREGRETLRRRTAVYRHWPCAILWGQAADPRRADVGALGRRDPQGTHVHPQRQGAWAVRHLHHPQHPSRLPGGRCLHDHPARQAGWHVCQSGTHAGRHRRPDHGRARILAACPSEQRSDEESEILRALRALRMTHRVKEN